jgi:hypothetical protein
MLDIEPKDSDLERRHSYHEDRPQLASLGGPAARPEHGCSQSTTAWRRRWPSVPTKARRSSPEEPLRLAQQVTPVHLLLPTDTRCRWRPSYRRGTARRQDRPELHPARTRLPTVQTAGDGEGGVLVDRHHMLRAVQPVTALPRRRSHHGRQKSKLEVILVCTARGLTVWVLERWLGYRRNRPGSATEAERGLE